MKEVSMLLALNFYRQWKLEHLCHKSGELITEAGYMDKVHAMFEAFEAFLKFPPLPKCLIGNLIRLFFSEY